MPEGHLTVPHAFSSRHREHGRVRGNSLAAKAGRQFFDQRPAPEVGGQKTSRKANRRFVLLLLLLVFLPLGPRNYQGKVDKKREAGRVVVCGWNEINFHSISDSKSNFRSRLEGEGSV